MRKRSAWGPTYFGPGNKGVTLATGQKVVQMLHFTQWSSVSRTSSTSTKFILQYDLRRSIPGGQADAVARFLAPGLCVTQHRAPRPKLGDCRPSAPAYPPPAL